ncbi:MAG: hypothetical protein O3B13_04415 [Planctomycetota bacterium]|nr:hypothetical protein [Planctomycetota bacterium]
MTSRLPESGSSSGSIVSVMNIFTFAAFVNSLSSAVRKGSVCDGCVDVPDSTFLQGVCHCDERPACDREVVDDRDVSIFHVADGLVNRDGFCVVGLNV